jgi:hypothetical protein
MGFLSCTVPCLFWCRLSNDTVEMGPSGLTWVIVQTLYRLQGVSAGAGVLVEVQMLMQKQDSVGPTEMPLRHKRVAALMKHEIDLLRQSVVSALR